MTFTIPTTFLGILIHHIVGLSVPLDVVRIDANEIIGHSAIVIAEVPYDQAFCRWRTVDFNASTAAHKPRVAVGEPTCSIDFTDSLTFKGNTLFSHLDLRDYIIITQENL